MITSAPSTAFEAICNGFATGLTGTLGVRVLDNAGATTTARVTAGIAEFPSGSGVYYVSLTAPSAQGSYSVMWDNGSVSPGNIASEDLIVTNTGVLLTPGPLANPSQPITVWADGFATGLEGTIGVRVLDDAGGTSVNRTTSGVHEFSVSGTYFAEITAPATNGSYSVMWDDGSVSPGHVASETIVVGPYAGAVVLTAVSAGTLTATEASAGSLTATPGSASGLTLTPASVGSLTLT